MEIIQVLFVMVKLPQFFSGFFIWNAIYQMLQLFDPPIKYFTYFLFSIYNLHLFDFNIQHSIDF